MKNKTEKEMKYVIVRSCDAGVFSGYLKSRRDREVVLMRVRRIWYWDGACSLSQLAMEGTKKPENCKFSVETNNHIVLNICEIIPTTEEARISIQGVKEWKV